MTMHYVFDSRDYIDLEAQRLSGKAVWFDLGAGEELGLISRSIPGSRFSDLVSAYGYPDHCNQNWAAEASDSFIEFLHQARRQGYISAYLRLGLSHSARPASTHRDGALALSVRIGEVVWIDVSQSIEEITCGYRKSLRYDLRQGHNLTIDRSKDFKAFHKIYTQNMERVGAAPSYFFDEEYIETLGEIEGVELWIASDSIGPVAGGLFLSQGLTEYYHLGATADRALKESPLKHVLHAKITELAATGKKDFVLGGGVGGSSDALLRFKRGFSKVTRPVYALRVVFDSSKYSELSGQDALHLSSDGFFPAYRAQC